MGGRFFRYGFALSLAFAVQPVTAATAASTKAIDAYVRPYADTNNFSGVVLVAKRGQPVFQRAYGFANRERQRPNRLDTRFHVASMSMQFTAAAALRLVNAGKLSLDAPVSEIVPSYPNGGKITVRHLLTQTSGIADINGQPNYAEVLKAHQTPTSLVRKVQELPPVREPGTYDGEEHSAYNLLALIVERRSGLPFAQAVDRLVFRPLAMHDSGIDDDGPTAKLKAAAGYQPDGLYGIKPAERIHWSAKTGNASAFTTVGDELKFVQGLYRPDFLKPELRELMFDPATPAAYGWFKSNSTRFGQQVLLMNGRAPGFAAAMIYLPKDGLFVVALSNIYASTPPEMVKELAALATERHYDPLALKRITDPTSLAGLPVRFQFPQDFYQPNAVVRVASTNGAVGLEWPSGDTSALIPTSKDHYIDRAYWMPVEVVRDRKGRIVELKYGTFTGTAAS